MSKDGPSAHPPRPTADGPAAVAAPAAPLLVDAPPLLLGAGGMLHRAFSNLLSRRGIAHRSFARRDLDLARPESFDDAIPADTRLIINCAAYTNVDQAEQDEPLARRINGHAAGALAAACTGRNALLVHFSTDYVFDGLGTRPYPPGHPRNPLSAYGRSKALGEELIVRAGCRHLIIRTSWLYAPWGKNFVRTIAAFATEGKPLKIVNDQRGRPTSAEHLAATILRLLHKRASDGIYHVTDGGEDCTWFDFAREIARLTNPACTITPIGTADLGRPARRPAYSVLDLQKTEALLGAMPPWQQNLADVLGRLE